MAMKKTELWCIGTTLLIAVRLAKNETTEIQANWSNLHFLVSPSSVGTQVR